MPVRHEIKSQLAKLLATEDLIVENKKVETAEFNVHTRVLTLPLWDRASNNVYDMLVGHEVGHALYTPDTEWFLERKISQQFVNIVEDVRIEKLIKRRYPGLSKTFFNAYNELSDKYKSLLDGLIAIHESEHLYSGRYEDRGVNRDNIKTPVANHPLIRTHPITGKKAIYVNRTFTTGIEGMNKNESSSILEFLFNHCEHVNFQIRYRWNKNDMAFWDNRCTMHRAIWDYWPNERKGRRVTIKGDKPV